MSADRCGYRIDRLDGDRWKLEKVRVRKGEWQYMMEPWLFDAISDEEFARLLDNIYRETAFEQLQHDLAVLAVATRSYVNQVFADMPPWRDIDAAIRRYEAAQENR